MHESKLFNLHDPGIDLWVILIQRCFRTETANEWSMYCGQWIYSIELMLLQSDQVKATIRDVLGLAEAYSEDFKDGTQDIFSDKNYTHCQQ